MSNKNAVIDVLKSFINEEISAKEVATLTGLTQQQTLSALNHALKEKVFNIETTGNNRSRKYVFRGSSTPQLLESELKVETEPKEPILKLRKPHLKQEGALIMEERCKFFILASDGTSTLEVADFFRITEEEASVLLLRTARRFSDELSFEISVSRRR